MATQIAPSEITYRRVVAIALPVVLSNATVPLQGAIDTAIIGNLGEARYLAAVVLGAALISLLISVFNFLQLGASGLTAQALGAHDNRRVMNTLARSLIVAVAIAAVLILFRHPLSHVGLRLFEGSAEAESLAGDYFRIRLWGAPAELANYALLGWFTGQELTKRLFEMQLVTSVANTLLNLLFVLGFGWGVEGVALGTVIAAYLGFGVGFLRVRQRTRSVAPEGFRLDWARILNPEELRQVFALNRDIFLRTICIVGGFAWIARLGSLQGDLVLAANGVLFQFLHITAYGLDGFAMAAETLVGQALGARRRDRLRRAVVVSTVAAFVLSAIFALIATVFAGPMIRLFTNVEEVRAIAYAHALWATAIPLIGVFAYQLDGIFIGAAEGRGMRNAMLITTGIFLPASWFLTVEYANHGLWLSVWLLMALRIVMLLAHYPALEARVQPTH